MTIISIQWLFAAGILMFQFACTNNHPGKKDGANASNLRMKTKDGITILLPVGWKLENDTVEGQYNVYTAENRDGGMIK